MKACPQCGKQYPDEFIFCPVHGAALESVPLEPPSPVEPPQPTADLGRLEEDDFAYSPPAPQSMRIPVRTLFWGMGILALCAILCFTGAFLYQYLKPKYGSLTIQTTPDGAAIFVDGRAAGASPLTIPRLVSGEHEVRIVKDGYLDLVQLVNVIPYAPEEVKAWTLTPVIPQLSAMELAEIESLRQKLLAAQKENILLPPPEDYNVLYFANKILALDPADAQAINIRTQLADSMRRMADIAYASENWYEAEKQYQKLAQVLPDDTDIAGRLVEIAERIDVSTRERERAIAEWRAQAEAAMKVGSLTPPDKDNALDAVRKIQKLEKSNPYVKEAYARIRELLQNRGDARVKAEDWDGARTDFRLLLQYFPEDKYGKARLAAIETRLREMTQQEKTARTQQQLRQRAEALRKSALETFNSGDYTKAITAWQEYLKLEPQSDEAWFFIGASYQNQKQLDAAITNFEKCLTLNPNNVLAHLNLGLLYDYHRGNFTAAEEHLQKARELGGAERYTPERLDEVIKELKERSRNAEIARTAIPVEHKHTFSSCRGTLHFSEDGMEFRTTDTDHSFYEAYKGMQDFVIDGNTLTIKTQRNKKYNFRFLNAADAARIRSWTKIFPIPIEANGDAKGK